MTLTDLFSKLTVRDMAYSAALGIIGYNLYTLREVVKVTVHKHTTSQDEKNDSSARSETDVSEDRMSDDFLFGFHSETW